MTKISSQVELLGAGVDQANDLLAIVDMSETGAARNKKIKVTQLLGLITDIVGMLQLKGSTDCSANPNYPVAVIGDTYRVSVAGKIGGASGKVVEVGDLYYALADNAGGTEAAVGTSWDVIQGNSISASLAVEDEGVSEATSVSILNFIGAGVTAADAGGGQVDITIPGGGGGVDVEDEGTPETSGATTLNFIGAGVTAADAGGGAVDITIPGGGSGIDVEDEGVSEATGVTTLNFTGTGITATDAGGGVVDINVPGSAAGPLTFLDSHTFTGSETTHTFSGISGDYDDLILIFHGRSDRAAQALSTFGIRFNSDSTAANYYTQFINASNATVNASAAAASVGYALTSDIPAATAPANYSSFLRVEISKYSGTTFQKMMLADLILAQAASAAGHTEKRMGAHWLSTAAITSIEVFDINAANFTAGSTVEIYGRAAVPSLGSGGVQSLPILASAMTPNTTSGAATGVTETTTNKVMVPTLDFDADADEFAQILFPMPKSWDEGTVTVQFIWTASSSSGDVVWGCQAVALSNDDALDTAFGTAQTVTDTLTATGDQCTTSFTSAITIGGSPAEGDLVCFQFYRDADNGSDTLAADAKLIAVRINITTDAVDDS